MKTAIVMAVLVLGMVGMANAADSGKNALNLIVLLDASGSFKTVQEAAYKKVIPMIDHVRRYKGMVYVGVFCNEVNWVFTAQIRSAAAYGDINKNKNLALKECLNHTVSGSRMDKVMYDVGTLLDLNSGSKNVVVVITDGVNEGEDTTREAGYDAAVHLKSNPPALFGMLGVNSELVLPWTRALKPYVNPKNVYVSPQTSIQSSFDELMARMKKIQ